MKHALRNPLALIGFSIIAAILLLALIAPWIAPYDPNAINVKAILLAPETNHWMGTDGLGRDPITKQVLECDWLGQTLPSQKVHGKRF